MKLFKKLGCSLLLIMTALFFLVGCGTRRTHKSNQINVVSSVNFYGDTAKAVLGRYGHVTSIIKNSSIDPHDFNPTDRDAEHVADADFVISNGMGYDDWMNSLSRDAPHAKRIRVGTTLLHLSAHSNPHVWYRVNTMPKLANYLAQRFSRKDPKHRKVFYRNARRYVRSLGILKVQMNWIKHHRQKSAVDVSEPVFNYALHQMGYHVHDQSYANAVEHGTDPSPEAIRGVQQDVKKHRIAFFVVNPQASDAIVNNLVRLAHRHHVPVIKITETMPNGSNYRDWMMNQNYQLEMILAKEKGLK